MQIRHMVCATVAIFIFGLLILIVGIIMQVVSAKDDTWPGSTVLQISGRVACVCGALLILATLGICLYLCSFSSSYGLEPSEAMISGQTERARCGRRRFKLRETTTTTTTRNETTKGNTVKWSDQPLSRLYGNRGDTIEVAKENPMSHIQQGFNVHNSLDLGSTSSNRKTLSFPRLSNRRRHQSADHFGGSFNPLSGLNGFTGLSSCGQPTALRSLWEPTLQTMGDHSVFRAGDETSARLLGGNTLEPLSSMLHLGGQARLGAAYRL